ncbi:MAG: transcription elongation factor GreAB [Deltaproteobacteria bacterium]|nr:transcription elongation factor GreAB [Deltaproteobacteria bacterium]
MDKKKLLEQLIDVVTRDLEKARQAAMASAAGATHEENKAEGNKDMRSTEAAYLARGQTIRVEELEDTLSRLRFLPTRPFTQDTPISAGALVRLENENGDDRWYWLVTGAAGYELHHSSTVITTITPQSPLGKELVERHLDDEIDLVLAGRRQQFEIVELI